MDAWGAGDFLPDGGGQWRGNGDCWGPAEDVSFQALQDIFEFVAEFVGVGVAQFW